LFGGAIKTNSDFALNDYGGIIGYKADDYSAIIQAYIPLLVFKSLIPNIYQVKAVQRVQPEH
jgi:hypothetical protein